MLCEGDRRLCHLCHLCWPCHHDAEGGGRGGGGDWKLCRGICCDMGKLHMELRLAAAGWLGGFGNQPPLAGLLAGAPPENSQNT